MGTEDRINRDKERAKQAAAGNFGNQSFNAQQQGALTMLQNQGMSRAEAEKKLSKVPIWSEDKYQGMLKNDAQLLREDWMKTQQAQFQQSKLDALRGQLEPPPPTNTPPAGGLPPEWGGTPAPAGPPPTAPSTAPAPMPAPPPAGGPPPVGAPPQDGTGLPAGDNPVYTPPPMDTGYSQWSQKAPQLQVQPTQLAPQAAFDYSHLQPRQPLQSAAEKFGGSTEAARALRAGIGSQYSGRDKNGGQ